VAHHRLALLVPLVLSAAPLRAQDTLPDPWTFTADLGYVIAAGNTELQTLNLGDKITFDPSGAWRFTQTANWVYSESEDETTANLLGGDLRGDYDLSARLAAYGSVAWYRNTFAGVSRRFSEGVGLGYKAWLAPRDTLTLEGGVSFSQERLTSGLTDDYAAARVAGSYRHQFAGKASFSLGAQFLPQLADLADYLLDARAELAAPLSTNLAIKLGYLLRYESEPAAGFEETDTIFTAGLQVTY
jgi:putative salt-induced outer membrane protein